MPQRPVLIDTNLIIECHTIGCWAALVGAHEVETVEQCILETQTGMQRRRPEQRIDETALRASLNAVHAVTEEQLAEVMLLGGGAIDKGEQHLWAHALSRGSANPWVLCGPDRGSLRFGYNAGLQANLISLEELFTQRNLPYPRDLHQHYGRAWHSQQLTQLRLGIL